MAAIIKNGLNDSQKYIPNKSVAQLPPSLPKNPRCKQKNTKQSVNMDIVKDNNFNDLYV